MSKVKVSCDGCGAIGMLELSINVNDLSVGGLIQSEQPCLSCGGKFSAPSGKYKKNADDELIRIGDYLP